MEDDGGGFVSIVLDHGSYSSKAGFAGDDIPQLVLPSVRIALRPSRRARSRERPSVTARSSPPCCRLLSLAGGGLCASAAIWRCGALGHGGL